MDSKKCNRCGETRAASDWHESQMQKSGRWCKPCMKAYYKTKNAPAGYVETPHSCSYCGAAYEQKLQRNRSLFCSRACKEQAYKVTLRDARLASKPARQCVQCGASMPPSMRADAKFCSAECNSAAHQLKRKLRNRGKAASDGYVRIEIADRDGWSCGICHIAWWFERAGEFAGVSLDLQCAPA